MRHFTYSGNLKDAIEKAKRDLQKEKENKEIAQWYWLYEKAKKAIETKELAKTKPSKSDIKALETAQNAYDKLVADKENHIKAAHEQADKERTAISEVEVDLLTMLKDPELRKRYFAIADMDMEVNVSNMKSNDKLIYIEYEIVSTSCKYEFKIEMSEML